MTTVEIPTHVCHVLNTHVCGEEAVIGHDCADTPLWEPLPCVDVDAGAVSCTPQSLTLAAPTSISLPLVPALEEAP